MTSARYLIGDTRKTLATLPPDSVDLVLTSPPFLALRSYLPADHPDKPLEMGSEPTPGEYIDSLLEVVEACARVLAPHGSMCIELGDTYSGSGGAGGDAWPLDKSLCLIPELFRISLVYGFNPLTGRQTPRWRARNVIRWCRPNPPVGALGDKVRPATSDIVIICRDRSRYFDLDAVRTAPSGVNAEKQSGGWNNINPKEGRDGGNNRNRPGEQRSYANSAGVPPLDHWWYDDRFDQDAWKISTQPYPGSHYATWPEKLCETPIEAMSPRQVCTICGKPSERIVDVSYVDSNGRPASKGEWRSGVAEGKGAHSLKTEVRTTTTATTGWTDCGHNSWRPGLVLDPFAGSGTTLQVATGRGRDAIGIDLDERNAELALGRVGPLLLTVENVPQ